MVTGGGAYSKSLARGISVDGASLLPDGSGGLILKTANGYWRWDAAGNRYDGQGNNAQWGQNGVQSVDATIATGGNARPIVVGNSPTPAAVTAGATPAYAPTGVGLSHTDATHPTPPIPNTAPSLSAIAFGTTTPIGGFCPLNFAGLSWWDVAIYVHLTANSLNGALTVQVLTYDETNDATQRTFVMPMVRLSSGASGTTIPAGIADRFTGFLANLPLYSNTSGSDGSSTQIMSAQLVAAGSSGSYTGNVGFIPRKVT